MTLQPLPAAQAEDTGLVGVSPELQFQQVHISFGFPGLPSLGEASLVDLAELSTSFH